MSERLRSLLGRVSAAHGSANADDAALRERLPKVGGLAALEREIASEIAHSLGRAGRKLEAALERTKHTLSELESPTLSPEERRLLALRFNQERALAEQCLRNLMIQREAIGLRRHTELFEFYPIPPRLPVT